jgi:hypothetical protein
MEADFNERLERDIDRELKRLRDLTAPGSLIPGVMARIEAQRARTAGRHYWQSWPAPIRAVCFVMLLMLFSGICYGGWELWRFGTSDLIAGKLATWTAPADALWSTVCALVVAASALVSHLGAVFIVTCIMISLFSYLACVGVGTILVRFAFVKVDERRNAI